MKMLSHFAYLKDAGFKFPANVQVMIILCKLPPTMEVVAQILSQTSPSKIKSLKPDGIVKVATLSFEQKGASHSAGGKSPQANKLSTVKHKQADPKFTQQQQQQGRSNGSGSGNAPAQGQGGHNHHGGKKVRAHRKRTQNAEFATYVHYEDGPVPTIDPRALAHTPSATNYGPLHSIILLRPSTWCTIWAWSPLARPSTPLTRSSRLHLHPWTSLRPVPHLSSALISRSASLWMWRTPYLLVVKRSDPSSMRTSLIASSMRLMRWSLTAIMRCR